MPHRSILGWATLLLALSAGSGSLRAADADGQDTQAAQSPIGRKVADFNLPDYRGKPVSLDDFKDKKFVVVAFLGTECPLAKLYGPRLAKLSEEFGPRGVAFVGMNPNRQDALTEIAAYARLHGIKFPLLKDLGGKVADQMGAKRTPEVFVLDPERVIRYAGRIDDQYGIGTSREQPQKEELQVALEELLAGKAVTRVQTEAHGCLIGRPAKPNPNSPVTFSKHVAPIFHKRCIECHRSGEIAPFSLTKYSQAAGWADTIAEVVEEGRMPPWHADKAHGKFANDRRLTDEEKRLILEWVRNGAPEGNPADAPPLPSFPKGWQLPREPDQVVYMSDDPYTVPAEGTVRYQYFIADFGFTEEKWLSAIEVQPGNRAVVHHILVFALTGDRKDLADGGVRGYLAAFVPGLRAPVYPEGMAKRVPAGAKLLFQIHYTPIGSEQKDRSKVGLLFADPKTVKQEVKTISAATTRLNIPPNTDDHKVEARSPRMEEGTRLLGFMPHMHLRGKAFCYEAIYPDDRKEIVLDVPKYDFNWQTSYRLAEPKPLPAGTVIRGIAHFDNSTNNPHNPDPSKTVRWGEQTWNEMMIGYFDIAVPRTAAGGGK